jgi:signal transduction histidine kinase
MRAARIAWLVLGLLPLAASVAAAPDDAPPQKRVLVIYSTRRDTQLPTIGDREMPQLLEQALSARPDYYSEHIDAARFPEAQYQQAFRDYLRLKYRGMRFDVVIASHRLAYDMAVSVREELFRDTPLVFLTQDRSTRRVGNSAEVIVEPDFRRTIALATRLQPDTTQVFVVSGSSMRDVAMERIARQQLASFEPRLAFTYLTGLSTDDLEQRLATLPEHAIVFYLIFYQDASGLNVNPLDYLDRLSSISRRPIYSWVDSAIDRGVVGGSTMVLESQIRSLASMAARVLGGERADSIQVSDVDLQVDQLDWRQLRRWSIDESRVPAGAILRFREPSRWERDRNYIIGSVAVLVVETALIVGLILQAARRRRAEAKAREAAAELRASYERIRDLGSRLLGAQDAERSRIARELHDDISQQLTLLSMDLALLSHAQGTRPDDAEKLAREAHTRVVAVAASVHQLSHQLHPARLRLIGLVASLTSLQQEIQGSGHRLNFTHDGVPDAIPQDLKICLYRIAQEAVQNAVKHSGAREITMSLTGSGDALTLIVADRGAGFDVDAAMSRGLGLVSMGERLEPFGGTLRIDSTPGAGTRIEATVPLAMPQAERVETA